MEYKMQEYVQELFRQGLDKSKVEHKVLQFFKDYDLQKEPEIARLNRKLDNARKSNAKVKKTHGWEFSGRSEVENLFLDCIEETKKVVVKRKEALRISKQFQSAPLMDDTMSDGGIESQNMIEQVVSSKEALLGVFEMLFGSGTGMQNIQGIDKQIKNQKYTIANPDIDHSEHRELEGSMSFFTNNDLSMRKQLQIKEYERLFSIMNAPIESLINYSKSQSNLSKGNARSKTISRRPLTVRIDQRAQTAIGSKMP